MLTPPLRSPLTVRIPEACRMTGIGRSKLYELIKAGEIETIKVGSSTLVTVVSLRAFLDKCRAPVRRSGAKSVDERSDVPLDVSQPAKEDAS